MTGDHPCPEAASQGKDRFIQYLPETPRPQNALARSNWTLSWTPLSQCVPVALKISSRPGHLPLPAMRVSHPIPIELWKSKLVAYCYRKSMIDAPIFAVDFSHRLKSFFRDL